MNEQTTATEEHLTLSQAARLAPGRPSANCVWRWCREGVKSKSGERVRLKHMRFGGRIYTTRAWLEAFGLALAEADAKHFERVEEPDEPHATPRRRPRRAVRLSEARRLHQEAERELEAEGL